MRYKYLIQNCNTEILNLSQLSPFIKQKIKTIFVQDETGNLLRHWSNNLGCTSSILYPNNIYLMEVQPSCFGVLLPQENSDYLNLFNLEPGHSQLPLVGDKVSPLVEDGVFFEVTDGFSLPFIIMLKNQNIEKARNMLSGSEPMLSIIGQIVKSPKYYNYNYSYHIDPDTIDFFELAMEVCDASFKYVEENLEQAGGAFLPNNVFCPWGSRITRELLQTSFSGAEVEDVLILNGQVKVRLNKSLNISRGSAPVFLEFFSEPVIPGSVSIENYCLNN